VVMFKLLSTAYSKKLATRLHKHQGLVPVTKTDFFGLFLDAWASSFTAKNIFSSFKATGVHPFNPHRTSTFPGQRKVDFHRLFVITRLKCLLKPVSQRPLSATGVVAGALSSFVFQPPVS
jgi:hypothetical protein